MPLPFAPAPGTIVICDYSGFTAPEMIKRRPAVVVSPQFKARGGLCTVVPFSTTAPTPSMPYHYQLQMAQTLPPPYHYVQQWVKCDMVATVALKRLDFPHCKTATGKRQYINMTITANDLRNIQACILHALGLSSLTPHL